MIAATLYNDSGCPWAYSANPALRVLEWRYRDQLAWRLVLIGLTEDASQYAARGYTPERAALGQLRFRRFGMPFSPSPKARICATARACRAVVAARILDPGSEWRVFRALALANFTTPLLLDDDAQLADALDSVPGLRGREIVAMLDTPEVSEAYERDRAESRTAAGSPTELQGKTAASDGPVRYTAPVGRLRARRRADWRRAAFSRSRPTTCSSRTSTLRSRASRRRPRRCRCSSTSPTASPPRRSRR